MTREENLEAIFRDGRTVILPIDHAVAIPAPGLENPFGLIERTSPHVDCFVMNLGLALRSSDLTQNKGVCLRTDAYNTRTEGLGAGSIGLWGIDTAEMIGAHAVMNMLYPWAENEETVMQYCADLIHSSMESDVPVILESLPYGLGQTDKYTLENVKFAVRMAAELGADVVKTAYPSGASAEEFKAVVEQSFVPVVVLGGAAMGDDASLFKMVENAMKAGAAGVAIGRNVWQHENPVAMTRSLAALVHEEATALEALSLMKETL